CNRTTYDRFHGSQLRDRLARVNLVYDSANRAAQSHRNSFAAHSESDRAPVMRLRIGNENSCIKKNSGLRRLRAAVQGTMLHVLGNSHNAPRLVAEKPQLLANRVLIGKISFGESPTDNRDAQRSLPVTCVEQTPGA